MRPDPRDACFRVVTSAFDLADLHAAHPSRYPHLLESVAQGGAQARYDVLFAFPGSSLVRDADGSLRWNDEALTQTSFLERWGALWAEQARASCPAREELPFRGGWFVFLAYEMAGEVEPRLAQMRSDTRLPLAVATRFPAAVIRDHMSGETILIREPDAPIELLAQMEADIAALSAAADRDIVLAEAHEDAPERYLANVERVKEYIGAGDVFQVNLARAWDVRLRAAVEPIQIYRRLRRANPAPFACLATWPDRGAVISSSPERLVDVRGRRVRTRPIAGTYPRSSDPAEDARWSRELLAHPKERAEHVMLIDLERNDLGRVCRPGSMRVNELMSVESYRHVHHIVSEVSGELRPRVTPADLLHAVFPGGTITGCPKVRCMEIINELEARPRGAYTGSIGYVNHDGSMDFNILIRTLVQSGDRLSLHAGAGIVADSIPARELAETRAKAKGLLVALGLA